MVTLMPLIRKTAKQQIEETPIVKFGEGLWGKLKSKQGVLKEIVQSHGSKYRTNAFDPNAQYKFDSVIHTHPIRGMLGRFARYDAWPSVNDLINMLQHSMERPSKRPFWHTASYDEKTQQVIGYTTFRFTEKIKDPSTQKKLKEIFDKAEKNVTKNFLRFRVFVPHRYKAVLDRLVKEGLLKIRYTPMPGYKYQYGKYVKRK